MRIWIFSFVFLLSISAFGQSVPIQEGLLPKGDTISLYKRKMNRLKKLSTDLIDTSVYVRYYRVWSNRQVVSLYTNSEGKTNAFLTSWTDEYTNRNEEPPTNRTFVKNVRINPDSTRRLEKLFFSSGVLNIPTGDSIKGWGMGFDGITYVVESYTPNTYTVKTYWTPRAQGQLEEAVQIQRFVDDAFVLANANVVWKLFSNMIPFECYVNGGPGVACKILTKDARKKYMNERVNYRKSINKN